MKTAVLGGGLTGLVAGYYLAGKGYKVTIFEKEKTLGGLAGGFKKPGWDWYLDKTYHHLFANDHEILNFFKEIGLNKVFFQSPETASLYQFPIPNSNFQFPNKFQTSNNKFQTLPLDTPTDLLRFPLLSLPQKLRAGATVVFLKLSPFFEFYNRQTAERFLKKTMGQPAWKVLWEELMRKKFGKSAGNILASFFWARIKKRTKSLGYIEGGFQEIVDYLEEKCLGLGVEIIKNFEVKGVEKKGNIYNVYYSDQRFDAVISTLPTASLIKITKSIFPETYINRLNKIKYLHNISFILESDKPFLNRTYWLNICDKDLLFTVLVQHTNFINQKYYGGKHILYIGNYVDDESKLLKMSDRELFDFYSYYLKKINTKYEILDTKYYCFRTQNAQQIFDKNFVDNKPDMITPAKNFFIANLDMSYPYDRGTNYAVAVGKKVAGLL